MPLCKYCQQSYEQSQMAYTNQCRQCRNWRLREWRQQNKDHVNAYNRRPERRKYFYALREKKAVSTPERFLRELLRICEKNCRTIRKNRERFSDFSLTLDDLIRIWDKQQHRCALTGITMIHQRKNLRSVSIDRIDSQRGYHPDNIQLVCRFVNMAKINHTNEELLSCLHEFCAIHSAAC